MARPHYEPRVVEAFVSYLRELEEGTTEGFESFCDEHEDDAPALRDLHRNWMRVECVVAQLRGQRPLGEELAERFGPEIDASVTLHAPPTADPAAPSALIQRLTSRSGLHERYRKLADIARGGMGIVSKVWDRDLRRNLAMKVICPEETAPGSAPPDVPGGDKHARRLARFLEEAQITSQLDHPGVVPVHDLGLDANGQLFFTMRYVKGRDFKQILGMIESGAEDWSSTRALFVILRVCEAMAYAHSKNVIHRDLKPSNVMVGRYGQVYVMDWGLARVLGREDRHDMRLDTESADPSQTAIETDRKRMRTLDPESPLYTMDGDVLGTPIYMSPEQARGEEIGAPSDVYSIGAMLYYLLSGHRPYCSADARISPYGIWLAVMEGPPRPISALRPAVPAELIAICEKAMARRPERRYASVEALADDLRAYLEHRVVQAYETGAGAELRKWVGRNKALATATAATILATIAGLGATSYVEAAGRRDAENERNKLAQVADRGRALGLASDEAELWPPSPEFVPAYERWIGEAEGLAESAREYERLAAELESQARPRPDGSWAFDNESDRGYHELLSDLAATIRAVEPGSELFGRIESRLEFAASVEERTLTGDEARSLWDEAIASIGEASSPYGGLAISPQLGLIPLGPDPESGLWEFAHVQTGSVPARATDGTLERAATAAVVLVLLPGGPVYIGAQKLEPNGVNYDPRATVLESPVWRADVAPFFVSKYELTQPQWKRIMGEWEFRYQGDALDVFRPVESVSWQHCREFCRRTGLQLPSEEQWEYAARAGMPFPFWTGPDESSLDGAENLFDLAATREMLFGDEAMKPLPFNDGWDLVAPVGRLGANAFGLHDVLGNVSEWCADEVFVYADEGGGERVVTQDGFAIRGGAFDWGGARARVSRRSGATASTFMTNNLGLRPVRKLEP